MSDLFFDWEKVRICCEGLICFSTLNRVVHDWVLEFVFTFPDRIQIQSQSIEEFIDTNEICSAFYIHHRSHCCWFDYILGYQHRNKYVESCDGKTCIRRKDETHLLTNGYYFKAYVHIVTKNVNSVERNSMLKASVAFMYQELGQRLVDT